MLFVALAEFIILKTKKKDLKIRWLVQKLWRRKMKFSKKMDFVRGRSSQSYHDRFFFVVIVWTGLTAAICYVVIKTVN